MRYGNPTNGTAKRALAAGLTSLAAVKDAALRTVHIRIPAVHS